MGGGGGGGGNGTGLGASTGRGACGSRLTRITGRAAGAVRPRGAWAVLHACSATTCAPNTANTTPSRMGGHSEG